MEVVVTTVEIRRAKLQWKCHHRQTNAQFFYGPDALPVAHVLWLDRRRCLSGELDDKLIFVFPVLQALDLSDGSSEEEDVVEEHLGDGAAYKMVFVVNNELSMGVGKVASQVAHAAIGLYRLLIEEQQRFGEMLLYWEQFG